ncbi:IcmO protein (plasmid) [Roseomonas mucosa]|uniref:hypothetical protein n=2 Tax=Roseomonadaceae TaxID=3385906 RepID=UPI000C1A84D2|nr:hypothetical protein [Roseomonas mucosa]ATR19304.1 hypothetical protein CTJ15_02795 [Roseomonas sp. FDAARGOS_362]MCG7354594.1 hypothetical protein [Roseomonas mucosa]UZO99394.1 IcmO protein [Roseomonas mucosa]
MASACFPDCPPDALRDGDAEAVSLALLRRMTGFRAVCHGPWRTLAARLIRALSPVLVWMRDHTGLLLDNAAVRFAMELSSIAALATRRRIGGEVMEVDARAMPEGIVWPLNLYLAALPGYDGTQPAERQGIEPRRHHANIVFFGAPA